MSLLGVLVLILLVGALAVPLLLRVPRGRLARHALAAAAVLVVSLPLSLILTILLMPLWSWLEASYGIESVGHSGPSEWCYGLVFVACLCIGGGVRAVAATRRDEGTVAAR